MIPIKDWIYLAAILTIVGLALLERENLIKEGERKVQTAQQAQQVKDAVAGQKAVGDLNDELQRLRNAAPPVPTVVRMYNSCPVQARAAPKGTVNPPSTGGSVSEVPVGSTGNGIDYGPGLQFIAIAGDIVSARNRALLQAR